MFGSDAAPYSQSEVARALAPLRGLEQRCYAGSTSARAKQSVSYEFIAYVDARGDVRAEPVISDARDARLLECLRTGIDALRFPAKGADQFHLTFALRP